MNIIDDSNNKKILVFEDDFVDFDSGKSFNGFGFKQEPFIFGDTFGFTIHRDSLDKDYIYYLYEKNKQELGIEFGVQKPLEEWSLEKQSLEKQTAKINQ